MPVFRFIRMEELVKYIARMDVDGKFPGIQQDRRAGTAHLRGGIF